MTDGPIAAGEIEASGRTPLGIIAGGGMLPFEIAAAARASGRAVFIAGIEGFVSDAVEDWPHGIFHLGTLSALFSMLKDAGCVDLVIAGRAERPKISSLRLDGKALRSLPRILSILAGGDDSVLTGLIRFIEEHGFRVVGVQDVAPGLIIGAEKIGRRRPGKSDEVDLGIGFAALRKMGPLDIGQAVVVINRRIVAVEAAEGTDATVGRIAALREAGRIQSKPGVGVMVKAPKPGQDLRIDLPTIGPETIDAVKAAGLAGLGIAAGGVLAAERREMEARIVKHGLFLVGRTVT